MIVLILGGTRSGKSVVAERVASRYGAAVTYVATGSAGADDPEMTARIAAHQARRPSSWTTIEAGSELVEVLRSNPDGPLLVDALGTWVATQDTLRVDAEALVEALADRAGPTVVVSEEVGMSVHPLSASGRAFIDTLGTLNQAVASVAAEVLLVVAGRVVPLESLAGS